MLFKIPSQRSFSTEQLDQRVRAGLVGHWTGGGSGNTWFDRSGYGNHGTLTNGPAWTLGQGNKRAAIALDGVNDFINCGGGLPATGDFTVSANVRHASNAVSGIAAYRNSGGTGWVFGLDVSGTLQLFDGNLWRVSSLVLPLTEWHHCAVASTGGVLTFYLDGRSGTVSATPGTGVGYFSIGCWDAGGSGPFAGVIDDVRIYNRALSAAEIALLASPSFSPVVQPPRMWSRLSTGNRRRRVICGGTV